MVVWGGGGKSARALQEAGSAGEPASGHTATIICPGSRFLSTFLLLGPGPISLDTFFPFVGPWTHLPGLFLSFFPKENQGYFNVMFPLCVPDK